MSRLTCFPIKRSRLYFLWNFLGERIILVWQGTFSSCNESLGTFEELCWVEVNNLELNLVRGALTSCLECKVSSFIVSFGNKRTVVVNVYSFEL